MMNWYYQERGGHTHVRVFMNGAKCGDLCFTNEEFQALADRKPRCICFVNEIQQAKLTATNERKS